MINAAVGNLIATAKRSQIYSSMETGTAQGMQTLEQDLARLWVQGFIREHRAWPWPAIRLRFATEPSCSGKTPVSTQWESSDDRKRRHDSGSCRRRALPPASAEHAAAMPVRSSWPKRTAPEHAR